jgi:hypothetical protein
MQGVVMTEITEIQTEMGRLLEPLRHASLQGWNTKESRILLEMGYKALDLMIEAVYPRFVDNEEDLAVIATGVIQNHVTQNDVSMIEEIQTRRDELIKYPYAHPLSLVRWVLAACLFLDKEWNERTKQVPDESDYRASGASIVIRILIKHIAATVGKDNVQAQIDIMNKILSMVKDTLADKSRA